MAIYRFREFQYDSMRDELKGAGQSQSLPPKVSRLLKLFLDQPGSPISHLDVKAEIWPETEVADASIYRLISDTRQALGDDPKKPTFIKTLAGQGYKFACHVEKVPDRRPSGRTWKFAWVGALALVLITAFWKFSGNGLKPHVERYRTQSLESSATLGDVDGDRLFLIAGTRQMLVLDGRKQWIVPAMAEIRSAILSGGAVYYLAGSTSQEVGLYRFDLAKSTTAKVAIDPATADPDVQTPDGWVHLRGWRATWDALPEEIPEDDLPVILKYVPGHAGTRVCVVPGRQGEAPRLLGWDPVVGKRRDLTPELGPTMVQAAIARDGGKAVYLARAGDGKPCLLVQTLPERNVRHIELNGSFYMDPVWYRDQGVVMKTGKDGLRLVYVDLATGQQTLLPEVPIRSGTRHFVTTGGSIAFQASPGELSFWALEPLPRRRSPSKTPQSR